MQLKNIADIVKTSTINVSGTLISYSDLKYLTATEINKLNNYKQKIELKKLKENR